jgi:hypothetical protein
MALLNSVRSTIDPKSKNVVTLRSLEFKDWQWDIPKNDPWLYYRIEAILRYVKETLKSIPHWNEQTWKYILEVLADRNTERSVFFALSEVIHGRLLRIEPNYLEELARLPNSTKKRRNALTFGLDSKTIDEMLERVEKLKQSKSFNNSYSTRAKDFEALFTRFENEPTNRKLLTEQIRKFQASVKSHEYGKELVFWLTAPSTSEALFEVLHSILLDDTHIFNQDAHYIMQRREALYGTPRYDRLFIPSGIRFDGKTFREKLAERLTTH